LKIKSHIPNALTCGNLLCGCLGIIRVFEGDLLLSCYLVGLALIFDFLDGFAARLLKVSSPVGKDLDSLADLVTFGVLPGILMYKLIDLSYVYSFTKSLSANEHFTLGGMEMPYSSNNLLKYVGLVIPVFSAIRLARFNNDTRQSESFIGLPTPANAIIITGFCFLICKLHLNLSDANTMLELEARFQATHFVRGLVVFNLLGSPVLLCAVSVALSFLLVSGIPMFSFKFKNFSWKNNRIKYVYLVSCLALIFLLGYSAIPLVIVLYLVLSIVSNLFSKS